MPPADTAGVVSLQAPRRDGHWPSASQFNFQTPPGDATHPSPCQDKIPIKQLSALWGLSHALFLILSCNKGKLIIFRQIQRFRYSLKSLASHQKSLWGMRIGTQIEFAAAFLRNAIRPQNRF